MVSKYVWQNYPLYYFTYLHRTLRDVCFVSLFPTLEYRKNAIFRHRKPFPRFFNVFPPLPSHVLRDKSGKSSVLSLLLHSSPFSAVPQQGNPWEKCIFVLNKYHAIGFSRSAKSKSDLFSAISFFENFKKTSISLPIFAFWERSRISADIEPFLFPELRKQEEGKRLTLPVFFFDNAEIGGKVQDSRIPKVDSKKKTEIAIKNPPFCLWFRELEKGVITLRYRRAATIQRAIPFDPFLFHFFPSSPVPGWEKRVCRCLWRRREKEDGRVSSPLRPPQRHDFFYSFPKYFFFLFPVWET